MGSYHSKILMKNKGHSDAIVDAQIQPSPKGLAYTHLECRNKYLH